MRKSLSGMQEINVWSGLSLSTYAQKGTLSHVMAYFICVADGKKKKKKKKSDFVQAKSEGETVSIDSMATEDQLEIEALLKQKKQEFETEFIKNEGKTCKFIWLVSR